MSRGNDNNLTPRNGHTLRAIIPSRVSRPGVGLQDERSNDDQGALLRNHLVSIYDGPVSIEYLPGSGSGENLERKEYLELMDMVETGEYDLVLVEDLGRIVRRLHAHLFCELCVEHGTRLIALNDHVDTAENGWQDRSIFSSWHHERSIRDNSERIKRTHSNRFGQGGCAAIPIYGYIKPPGAKSIFDWRKDPAAEAIYKEWFEKLDREKCFTSISEWLTELKIPTGEYCKPDWDSAMVARVSRNPILKGVRERNRHISVRMANGKYKTVKADPKDLKTQRVPHLAFFEEEYYDRVIGEMDEKTAKFSRGKANKKDPRKNLSRKRTKFPGQTMYCIRCGYKFVWGGHGQAHHLQCDGTRQRVCWQSATIDGPLAAKKIFEAVLSEIEKLSDYDTVTLEMIREELALGDTAKEAQMKDLRQKISVTEKQIENLLEFIRSGDKSRSVRDDLLKLEEELPKHQTVLERLAKASRGKFKIPDMVELKSLAQQSLGELAIDSYEFADEMRRLTHPIMVAPYRACDGGAIVLRAHFGIQLANLLPDPRLRDLLSSQFHRPMVVDLFEPVQRIAFLKQVVQLRETNTVKQTTDLLGITLPVVSRATKLHKFMQSNGMKDPFQRIYEPVDDLGRMRCHKHPKYKFRPKPGHVPG